MAILNPNDGVIYLKVNGPASLATTNWDWKLPSQSYGQYPGPWQSLGLWYQDQSGSNASGQVNLYESDAELAIPSIVAIGRAAQVAGTTVDITQGTIPQSPPQNTSRLWVDATGTLHLVDSNGNDRVEIDSNNINSYVNPLIAATALGGDLYGTIPNGHVWAHSNPVQLDRTINVQWGTNSNQDRIVIWSDANMYFDLLTGLYNFRTNGTTIVAISSTGLALTGNESISGSLGVTGQATFTAQIVCSNGIQSNGDITTKRGAGGNTGVYYFVDGNHYIYWDGSVFTFQGGNVNFSGSISVNGFTCTGNGSVSGNFNGANGISSSSGAGDFAVWVRSQSGQLYVGTAGCRIDIGSGQMDYLGPNGSTNHRFFHADGSWMGTQAANFQQQSDARLKVDIQPISDDDCLARIRQNVSVISWQPDWQPQRAIGFTAQDLEPVVPEVVTTDEEGNMFVGYANLAALIWGALRQVDGRLSKLESTATVTP